MSLDVRERLPSARTVGTTLAVLLLVAVLVPFVVFAVPQVVGADHGFVILSGSMEPTVAPGDVVIVDASASVGVGDIVTFDDGNVVPTTHRIVGVENGMYVTQGDANQQPDNQLVAPSDVLGRVTLTIPLIGHVILWVNTPTGYVSLVLAPLVLLVASELFVWARRDEESDDPAPKPAIRHIDDVRAEREAAKAADRGVGHDADERETVAVAVADLKLTILAMVGLVGYAAWNVYREVTTLAAPNPVSVGALTGGLLGLGFAVWVTVSARLAAGTASDADRSSRSRTARADGGREVDR